MRLPVHCLLLWREKHSKLNFPLDKLRVKTKRILIHGPNCAGVWDGDMHFKISPCINKLVSELSLSDSYILHYVCL